MKLKKILNEIIIKNIKDTIIINGIEKTTKNSNNQFIHNTIQGIKNFYNWFGNSKFVDSDGRPLVIYHGTASDFNKFNKSTFGTKMGDGIYFTSIKSDAIKYSDRYGGNGKVMEVYLKGEDIAIISNPFAKKELPSRYDSIWAFKGRSGEEIMVKESEQIKAVSNNGQFSHNDDIYK